MSFAIQITIAMGLVLLFSDMRLKLKGLNTFRALFFLPNIITIASVTLLFSILLNWKYGPLNQMLLSLNLIDCPINWLNDQVFVQGWVALIGAWMWFGCTFIILMAGISSILKCFYEAAYIDGAKHYEKPAPFNQDFYMILNLAVGGWYGLEPDASTELPGQVEVDYVRVYEDANANYDKSPSPLKETVEEPEEPADDLDRDPANWEAVGDNLVTDGSFDDTTTFGAPESDATWKIFNMADHDPNGGKGEFSVVDNVLNTVIQQVGWDWWQIQLYQNLDVVPSGTYRLSFDMASEHARNVRVELINAGLEVMDFTVNEEMNTYEAIVEIENGEELQLLFGLGRLPEDEELETPYTVMIDNVSLKEVEFVVEEEPVEEEPGDETDPENGETPVEGEEPGDENDDKNDNKNDDKQENEKDDEKDDLKDDQDEEKDKQDKDDKKEAEKSDAEDEEGEKLPETATAVWSFGALGLTGLGTGLGLKVFKKD
ncbi:hypothetical protein AB4027_04395 [Alkalibacterium putridalgicola]|uniref:hypothetical protein n=1 Tax=Alkalibacterium putridalgicola TaxID=426703 RepID=UPI0034CE0A3A